MIFLDDFMVRALLAAIGVAVAAAPLGCFIVWRRMAYFGDATAHASILGVAIALALSVSIFAGALLISLLMAMIVSVLSGRGYAVDTSLGVLAHSALAIGLVVTSLLSGVRIDLMGYLFGDILSVGKIDLFVIWLGAIFVVFLLWWRWSKLLIATLNADLARSEGINPQHEQFILSLALALIVAVGIKVVGVLLISAMLIIPAAASRVFANTPERMALYAIVLGSIAALGGLLLSYQFDTPTGPTIVSFAAALFSLCHVAKALSAPSFMQR